MSTLQVAEILSALGYPARLVGRLLLLGRYASWHRDARTSAYAMQRFGPTYWYRPWLAIDINELATIEELINYGDKDKVEAYRSSQLSMCGMIGVMGALVAQAGLSALALPQIDDLSFICRGAFIISLMMGFLSVFFTCIVQQMFGPLGGDTEIRRWLSNGHYYQNPTDTMVRQSSLAAYMTLQAPFEFVCIAIATFFIGFAIYLGMINNIDPTVGNRDILIVFVALTIFASLVFSHTVGIKDREQKKTPRESLSVRTNNLAFRESMPGSEQAVEYEMSSNTTNDIFGDIHAFRLKGKEGRFELAHALRQTIQAHQRCAIAESELVRLLGDG